MTFNPQKNEFLRIINKHNNISSSYYFKDISIPLSNHVKYLGVIIDKNLNWSQHYCIAGIFRWNLILKIFSLISKIKFRISKGAITRKYAIYELTLNLRCSSNKQLES